MRFLADRDDPRLDLKLQVFRVFVLLHLTFRLAIQALDARGTDGAGTWWTASLLMGSCLAAGLRSDWSRIACAAGLLLLLAEMFLLHGVWYSFSNHLFIEISCLALLTLWNTNLEQERDWLQRSLRALTVIVLFHTGMQKVWYGTYFDGQFLAHRVSIDPSFATVFRHLMPAEELQRLLSYSGSVGDGPFRVDSTLFELASNATYLAEMLLAILLTVPRLRRAAVAATLALLVLIESAAREFEFGALFSMLLLLFLPGAANRHAFLPLAVVYVVIVVMKLGWIPWFYVT